MEKTIVVLLAIIALELFLILRRSDHQLEMAAKIKLIWDGLFNTPHSGFDKLSSLTNINAQLKKLDSLQEIAEKISDISETTDVIKDELVNKD